MVKTSLHAEANSNVQYIRWHFSEGWLYDFEKPKHTQTRRSATTGYRPWRLRCARVKRQLLGKRPGGPPHLRELLMFCTCVKIWPRKAHDTVLPKGAHFWYKGDDGFKGDYGLWWLGKISASTNEDKVYLVRLSGRPWTD